MTTGTVRATGTWRREPLAQAFGDDLVGTLPHGAQFAVRVGCCVKTIAET